MISTLHIKNIGIIEDLSIDFNEGFNVLTGETGAGKTLIIGALGIIAGGRFSKDMIRNGEKYSFVEASIFCPENPNAIDGNIIVSREVYANGRNSCKINGRLVTVNELKEFMEDIIDIHGQQDNQNLLNQSKHISYLDDFIGNEITGLKLEYAKLFKRYNEINSELDKNYGDDKEKERRLDLLNYQLKEIENAKLKIGEDIKLNEEHNLMKNSEKLQENLEEVDNNLSNQAIESVSNSIRCLEKIVSCGEVYEEKLAELKNVYYEIQELSRDISSLKEDIFFDEEERDNVEKRLDEIFSLKRKYGNSIEEILKYKEELEAEINAIENLDEINNKLKHEKETIKKQMLEICNKMTCIREKYAQIISDKINLELKDLEMGNANLRVVVEKLEKFNLNGLDIVEFMICTNKGEDEKELCKIASGGEMSRVMLAIKTVLAEVDKVSTLIFDEIDTGISGKAAKAVGEKLKTISNNHQVMVVTHSASIAAKGRYNYYISKKTKNEKTYTEIRKLNEEEVLKEIARISSGDITDISIAHAKELRKAS
jgi:DNA repair protein RecN (Recombination protein N)